MPAGAPSISSMRVETRGVTSRAHREIFDVFGKAAERGDPLAGRGGEVDVGPAWVLHPGGSREAIGDPGTDLEATGADARTDDGAEGRGFPSGQEPLSGGLDGAGHETAPARVDGGERGSLLVPEDDGETVRGGDGERQVLRVRDQDVTDASIARARRRANLGAVHLVQESTLRNLDGRQQAASVFVDGGLRVPGVEAEIQGCVGGIADAPLTSRERDERRGRCRSQPMSRRRVVPKCWDRPSGQEVISHLEPQ